MAGNGPRRLGVTSHAGSGVHVEGAQQSEQPRWHPLSRAVASYQPREPSRLAQVFVFLQPAELP
jgi:hypothetical protein